MYRPGWIVAAIPLFLALSAAPAWSDNNEASSADCEKACDHALDTCNEKCRDSDHLELCPQECLDKQQDCEKKCAKVESD